MTAFEVIQEFPAAMADRAGAWDFIRGFAARWRSPLADTDGWSEGELDAAEARLGLRLLVAQTTTLAERWFAAPDLVIRDDQRTWVWVRARTTEALDQIRAEFPGEWMMEAFQ